MHLFFAWESKEIQGDKPSQAYITLITIYLIKPFDVEPMSMKKVGKVYVT